ncbi:MAG: hypothetical protein P4L28_07975 [Paludibacteraceae bacterium]|nr:hypothetical protein [Paludibacteraceae bacterium]
MNNKLKDSMYPEQGRGLLLLILISGLPEPNRINKTKGSVAPFSFLQRRKSQRPEW